MLYSFISRIGQKLIISVEWLFDKVRKQNYNTPIWAEHLCQHRPEIQEEFLKLYDQNLREFSAISSEQKRITRGNSWRVFIFKAYNRVLKENCKLCPVTSRLCSVIPQITSVMFSVLEPGTHITPHRGPYAGVLRCHIPLIIPEGDCGIRVGDRVHRWTLNQPLVFDDTVDHEAWNRTSGRRVVLFIDFVRPMTGPRMVLNKFMIWLIGHSPFVGRMLRASL